MKHRIHKLLAWNGLASRRTVEQWIEAGRVSIDGRQAQIGMSVAEHQEIELDGAPLDLDFPDVSHARVLLYHKREGELSSTNNQRTGRPTVFENLPDIDQGKWLSCGRLDLNSGGLMIFTNDGDLAHEIAHPSSNIDREYRVRIAGKPSVADLQKLKRGFYIDGENARFWDIVAEGVAATTAINRWYRVTVTSGQKRIVRRLWEQIGCRVNRLIKVRHGAIALPARLRPSESHEVGNHEISVLRRYLSEAPLRAKELAKMERKIAKTSQLTRPGKPARTARNSRNSRTSETASRNRRNNPNQNP